jgi:hypothetical protein
MKTFGCGRSSGHNALTAVCSRGSIRSLSASWLVSIIDHRCTIYKTPAGFQLPLRFSSPEQLFTVRMLGHRYPSISRAQRQSPRGQPYCFLGAADLRRIFARYTRCLLPPPRSRSTVVTIQCDMCWQRRFSRVCHSQFRQYLSRASIYSVPLW